MNATFQWILLFIKDLYDKRYTIYQLARRDFTSMYSGSVLGIAWSFLQPLAITFILWFVFVMGFKRLPVDDVPFVIWLLGGLTPWYFFSGCLSTNTGVIRQYSYLVKRTNFRVSILPIVKILSALVLHAIFLGILLGFMLIYRIPVSIYWLQVFYYIGAMSVLLLGISWITSSLNIFLKDIMEIVRILLQLGFWMSPIVWNADMFSPKYQAIFRLNPMFYIIQGYRESFIYHVPFWQHGRLTVYFWSLTLCILMAGMLIYKRLRPHFADVL